jgi:putative ABC transport system permease protein
MIGTALILVLALSAPFLFVIVRRPILRRLAIRNAIRRPREAALVVVGSMLGAAIITGSFVVGDAMNASIREIGHTHLGPADELVVAQDRAEWKGLTVLLKPLPERMPSIDGVLPIATMQAGVTARVAGEVTAAPRSQVIAVDFAAGHGFGRDPRATGLPPQTPGPGHAAITTDLSGTLGVGPGDRIEVTAYGTQTVLAVDRILPRRGIAGFNLGPEQDSRNVLVSFSTFDRIRGKSAIVGAPPTWAVLVSNRGGVESGVGRTDAARAAIADAAGPLAPPVLNVKRDLLDTAEATGKGFTQMFTATGSFGVIAGLLLLVQLFVMLAAERKPELGMARAVGMRRRWLVAGFATEGWLYALVATAVGTAVGVGLGRVLIAFSQRIFSSEHSKFDLMFVVRPQSLALAFAIGFVFALVTIVVTSVRVSRLNIIRAIRDIPEPPSRRKRRWLVVGGLIAALGGLWTVAAVSSTEPFGLIMGPTLLLGGLSPALARLASPTRSISVAALALVVWGAVAYAVFPDAAEGASEMIYVVQGIVLTGGAVLLVTLQQERISSALKRLGGRRLAMRLGLAYPLARRSRTGLTVAMYALVVFILVFITTISHLINNVADDASAAVRGGYDVYVSSSTANPINEAELRRFAPVLAAAPLATTSANFTTETMTEPARWNMTAFDSRLVDGGPPELQNRGRYASDRAAWRAVLDDPSKIIVDEAFLQEGGGPPDYQAKIGSPLMLEDPVTGRQLLVTVGAISYSDYFIQNGAWYGAEGARALFGDRLVPSRYYVALNPGDDPDAFASAVQGHFLANGTEAASIDALMDEAFTMTNQMFQLFEGYLALGLLVGIAGIAVVMIRAVRERRRPIGTLRAIGYPSRTIGRSFAIETAFIAIEGTVIGASLALLTLYTLVTRSDAMGDVAFSVPWLSLIVLLVGTVAASLLATVAPAVSASRIRPAVALRTTD